MYIRRWGRSTADNITNSMISQAMRHLGHKLRCIQKAQGISRTTVTCHLYKFPCNKYRSWDSRTELERLASIIYVLTKFEYECTCNIPPER